MPIRTSTTISKEAVLCSVDTFHMSLRVTDDVCTIAFGVIGRRGTCEVHEGGDGGSASLFSECVLCGGARTGKVWGVFGLMLC